MPLTDPSELFQKRIDALKKMRGELDDGGKALVDAAVLETVAAGDAFLSLSRFAVRMSQSLNNSQQKSSAMVQQSLEQLRQMRLSTAMILASPSATQEEKDNAVATLNRLTAAAKNSAIVAGATEQYVSGTFATSTTMLVNVLSEQILRPNHHEFNVKVVQDIIDFSLVIVVTHWPSLAYLAATTGLILKIFVFNRIPPTDARKVYLENYIASLRAWIQAVNVIIEAFESAQVQA